MKTRYQSIVSLVIGVIMLTSLSTTTFGVQPCEKTIATAMSVQGIVEVQRQGETEWQTVKLDDTYCPGDTIRVQENSRADVALANQSVLRLNANTTMTLKEPKEEKTSVVDMLKGVIHFFSRGPKSLEVQTPFTTAGVRGTEFLIDVDNSQTLVSVFEGEVLAENEAGSLTLRDGQSAVAEKGKAPVIKMIARPRDAVRWALYYPPVFYLHPNDFQAGSDWQGKVRKSIEFYLNGILQKAFDSIENMPTASIQDSRFFAYRASLLLSVGRVDEASSNIEQALSLNPKDSNAMALQTIIAVVQNNLEEAFTLAQQAVTADPNSATARIAFSYVQQARFNLAGAQASVAEATRLAPDNALAWARLAELWSSSGDLDSGLYAAWKAAELAPELSRTQTVLGFAYLMKVETALAKDTFAKAITLDQADPLPRLGMGLAKIREGDLDEGSREIEIAASLDSSNSLVRSYLGKAYFEEKRLTLSEREYATAKELDPMDPTPWFYDAIQKQTTNRPVEALRDIEKAIELNDNRAVYRSRLLLDSDLAARSASLARVYSDLGFQQLALVEGWKSVNTDPSNFSAHRFLADSYTAVPRHKIARVSELLQAQHLQPINQTPIQPQLAESNLFLISSGGPGAAAFNEFNPLFSQDGLTLQTSGFLGENTTSGGEAVMSGIYDKFSFSGGFTHFETEGFRANNDQNDDIANAFVQAELTEKTSVQAEYRYRKTESGDLKQSFFDESISPSERREVETESYRLGLRHTFSPSHVILGSIIHQRVDNILDDPSIPFSLDTDPSSIGPEIQYLFRSQYLNISSGIGHFEVNEEEKLTSFFGENITDRDISHTNMYTYTTLNYPENVTLTLGASIDLFQADHPESKDQQQFNPKFGITWNPFPDTIVRAAAFRVLKRTLITDQTLEPTQVAGFNQFFDDAESTESWRYGGAIDQKFSENLFGGVEYSKRDLEVPFFDFINNTIQEVDWDEYLGRAYLFWTPHDWFALRAEYSYERAKRDREFVFGIKEADTHRVPLGISFFHPSGLSLSLTTTYFNQDGEFEKEFPGEFFSGDDDFWIVDAAIRYRLPKRYGIISVGATNLFNEEFQYQDTAVDPSNPIVQPERVVFARITLSF